MVPLASNNEALRPLLFGCRISNTVTCGPGFKFPDRCCSAPQQLQALNRASGCPLDCALKPLIALILSQRTRTQSNASSEVACGPGRSGAYPRAFSTSLPFERRRVGRDPVIAGRVPAELIFEMDEWAKREGITRSTAMATLIERGLRTIQTRKA
jgi:hypothetical protein